MATSALFVATLVLLAVGAPQSGSLVPPIGPSSRPNSPPDAKDVVKVEHAGLWRDAAGRVIVGVRFTMAPKWHIYWSNPGDSGLSPQFKLALPDGWTLGDEIFPRPDVFEHDDETTFGYEERCVLLLPFTASAEAVSTRVAIEARYLVCKGICLSGDGCIEVDLPDRAAIASLPMVPEVVEGRSIPKPLSAAEGRASAARHRLVIEGALPAPTSNGDRPIRFLPFDFPGFRLEGSPFFAARSDGTRFRLEVPIELDANDAPAQTLRAGGLVTIGAGRADPCFEFTLQVAHATDSP